MLLRLLELKGPIPAHGLVSFQNTGKEDNRTLDFVQRVAEHSGVDIHWLEFRQEVKGKPFALRVDYASASRAGEPFELALKFENGYLPSHDRRWCTRKMKLDTLRRYCVGTLGWKRWISYSGIRADEEHRLGKKNRSNRDIREYPLVEMNVTKEMVREFWRKMPFDLELPEIQGKNFLGNCTGCFLKSELDAALLFKHRPEEYAWWENIEESSGQTFHSGWSYKQLREKIESGHDKFALVGYFCAKDQGECTGDL